MIFLSVFKSDHLILEILILNQFFHVAHDHVSFFFSVLTHIEIISHFKLYIK